MVIDVQYRMLMKDSQSRSIFTQKDSSIHLGWPRLVLYWYQPPIYLFVCANTSYMFTGPVKLSDRSMLTRTRPLPSVHYPSRSVSVFGKTKHFSTPKPSLGWRFHFLSPATYSGTMFRNWWTSNPHPTHILSTLHILATRTLVSCCAHDLRKSSTWATILDEAPT